MIQNDDKPGHWNVDIFAVTNAVHGFQCPTVRDAEEEARRLMAARTKRGLPSRAVRRLILGRTRSGLQLGEPIAIQP